MGSLKDIAVIDLTCARSGPTAVQLSRTPSEMKRPAPTKGQHSREILRELGYSDTQIDDWVQRQIV
jgi:crotonobetainyl-CoA:carnitine CoA-transferase CaiB-like acyl-CoA transferase